MHEAAAVSALAVTLGLTLRRPELPSGVRVGPGLAATAGVVLAFVLGGIDGSDVTEALETLWRPFLALVGLMIITGVASRVGLMDRLAAFIVPHAGGSASRLFTLVFLLSLGTAAVLNNDAAILLLTPVVILLVRSLYPARPDLLLPFAFAVFMAAGVAPFVTSNPMNTVVAGVADIDFNAYAARMVPVALAGSVVTFAVLWLIFAAQLRGAPAMAPAPPVKPWTRAQRQALTLVMVVLVAYPVCALAGVEVYAVALTGAALALVLVWRHRAASPVDVVRRNVAWEILVFLLGMFLLAEALRNAGVVDHLVDLYESGGTFVIGVTSALGSALINNHSMALTNLLALEDVGDGASRYEYLAALVGGDLGPRLLPIGSLAGLLWLALLRTLDVEVTLRRFVTVGLAVTVPSLAVSLGVLALVS